MFLVYTDPRTFKCCETIEDATVCQSEIGGKLYFDEDYAKKIHKDGIQIGLKKGITLFAWWKDGVQFVGTCGTTLKQALKDIEEGRIL